VRVFLLLQVVEDVLFALVLLLLELELASVDAGVRDTLVFDVEAVELGFEDAVRLRPGLRALAEVGLVGVLAGSRQAGVLVFVQVAQVAVVEGRVGLLHGVHPMSLGEGVVRPRTHVLAAPLAGWRPAFLAREYKSHLINANIGSINV